MIKDDSPLSLRPETKVEKMARWPLLLVLGIGTLLLGILVYSVNFAYDSKKEEEAKKIAIDEHEKPLVALEGRGLSLAPPKGTPAVITPQRGVTKDPLIVVRDNARDNPYDQEYENLRKQRMQNYVAALSAPIVVKRVSPQEKVTAAPQGGRQPATTSSGGLVQQPTFDPSSLKEGAYDPAASKDKEAFLQGRSQPDVTWISPHTRTEGQELEIKTGWVIPAVMISGVNSDLPGQLIAQVSQNIFDTANGRYLLVPQGSKLFGIYDSRVIYGQERVLVAWNRIVFPDGSALTLGSMPGADMSGYSGFTDQVNNHYWRIFGSAFMMSLITGGSSYAMDTFSGDRGDSNVPTFQDQMGTAMAAQFGQATTQLLQKNLNIAPTLEIRPGYQFNIVVTKDLVFEEPYSRWED